jgi:acetyl-CoA acetyltransferase
MNREVAVLGVGMHPWGKWGRNFVEYGVHAARAALRDADLSWRDVQFISGAATMRCGYPGYVAGATFAQALGWQGAQVNTSYAACLRLRFPGPGRGARADPRRRLRGRPGDRR